MVGAVPHGIARYVTRLASGLRGMAPDLRYEPVFLVSQDWPGETFAGFRQVRTDIAFLARRELWALPRLIESTGASLFHSPSFSSLPVWSLGIPWIQTIHDLNHLYFGDWKQKLYYRFLLRPFARKASALATVSEFSRQEIAPWLGLAPTRIEVVPNALEPELLDAPGESERSEVLARLGLSAGRYFFCLSNEKPHKNLGHLSRAYATFREGRGDAFPLVLSIQDPTPAPGILPVGGLTDREARVLRASAAAVFFPSLYEGFGLPPVEAALAGVPLAVSDIPPHREGLADLVEGEALWVDPRDLEGWVAAFSQAQAQRIPVASPEKRKRILQRFSEHALASHMDRLYRDVIG